MLGPVRAALLLPAPGLGVLQVGLGEEGDPFRQIRVKELGKLLKWAQALVDEDRSERMMRRAVGFSGKW